MKKDNLCESCKEKLAFYAHHDDTVGNVNSDMYKRITMIKKELDRITYTLAKLASQELIR